MFSTSSILIGISLLITLFISEFKWPERKHYFKFALMIVMSIVTFLLTEWKETKKDEVQQKEKKISDSLYQVRTISAVGNVVTAFGKAVGEYNLRIDSGFNGVIKIMKDSSKRIINQVVENDPDFGPCLPDSTAISFEREDNGWVLAKLNFCSQAATSRNIQLKVVFVVDTENGLHFISTNKSAFYNSDLIKEVTAIKSYHFNMSKATSRNVYVYMYGNYKSVSKANSFHINRFFALDCNTGKPTKNSYDKLEKVYSLLNSVEEIKNFLKINNLELRGS